MTTFLHKPYLVKVLTKEEGVENTQKSVHVVYAKPLNENEMIWSKYWQLSSL